ncbi:hypothetical protein MARPU_01545 [Marichromatium purpuratum 984]|uniref:Polyketide cyclase n=1 Tax=Marichromatium purpuratum 984 TaxID=765910 RepID=W0DZK0_MARPU|nr:hypothetical protein [Marichromatium purpuratum]AHF02678.1 hypothetical protein MARPU_01545 [Marichromatium purpuratum 984]
MERFALARVALTAQTLQSRLGIAVLADCCASIDRVLWHDGAEGEIYCLWGQFLVRRACLRGGVRFALPECPNALAWTLTETADGGAVMIHCTIARVDPEPEFVESIETFVEDWRIGLERCFG